MGFSPNVPEGCPFTLDNIPFGVISTVADPRPRCATAIGDYAVDLQKCFQHAGLDAFHNLDLIQIFGKVSRGYRNSIGGVD